MVTVLIGASLISQVSANGHCYKFAGLFGSVLDLGYEKCILAYGL
jgi:hypothetical protein